MYETELKIIFLGFIAFFPCVIYIRYIHSTGITKRYEPWKLIYLFLWGAGIAITISIFIEIFLLHLITSYPSRDIFFTIIIAPFVEEFIKPLGIRKSFVNNSKDGMISGAIIGFGFASTENMLYEGLALSSSMMVFLMTVCVRTIACSLIHASATSVTGYGLSKAFTAKTGFLSLLFVIPFYLISVCMHSLFNYVTSMNTLYGLSISIIFSIIAIWIILFVIRR